MSELYLPSNCTLDKGVIVCLYSLCRLGGHRCLTMYKITAFKSLTVELVFKALGKIDSLETSVGSLTNPHRKSENKENLLLKKLAEVEKESEERGNYCPIGKAGQVSQV